MSWMYIPIFDQLEPTFAPRLSDVWIRNDVVIVGHDVCPRKLYVKDCLYILTVEQAAHLTVLHTTPGLVKTCPTSLKDKEKPTRFFVGSVLDA